jgi:hypothetical protein
MLLRRVALVRIDVSEEPTAFIIRVTRMGDVGTTLALTSNRRMLRRPTEYSAVLRSVSRLLVTASVVPISPDLATTMEEAPISSETSVLTRATRRNIPEDTILQTLSVDARVELNLNYLPYNAVHKSRFS